MFAGCLTSDGFERVTQATSRRVMPLSLDVTDTGNIREVVECMTSAISPQSGNKPVVIPHAVCFSIVWLPVF